MPERPRRRLLMILRATITLDGKLDGTPPQTVRGDEIETLDGEQCRALLLAGGVDEIHLSISPRIDGLRDSPTLSGSASPEFFPRSLACRLLGMELRGGDCFLRYRVLHSAR